MIHHCLASQELCESIVNQSIELSLITLCACVCAAHSLSLSARPSCQALAFCCAIRVFARKRKCFPFFP